EFADNVKQEFLRVVVHGLIHLIGYDDQSEEEKKEMTRLENMYLSRIGEF
ncbi:MAG TPA: rRNA maturation RNase YbeY, partial [Balneolaceae bacterium]|nr:rRNA maturation RNase YbeY [Balneolaceae bacterium]